ncbi:hypothetical protein SAMN05428939_0158 [Streptomyces sp. TLI_105]|nr:hypothetical protein SAMN05428939_0158 [Streptomyces sp. TLI_105]
MRWVNAVIGCGVNGCGATLNWKEKWGFVRGGRRQIQTAVLGGADSEEPLMLPLEAIELDAFSRRHEHDTLWCGLLLGGCGLQLTTELYTDRVCHFAHHPGPDGHPHLCGRRSRAVAGADHLYGKSAADAWLRTRGTQAGFEFHSAGGGADRVGRRHSVRAQDAACAPGPGGGAGVGRGARAGARGVRPGGSRHADPPLVRPPDWPASTRPPRTTVLRRRGGSRVPLPTSLPRWPERRRRRTQSGPWNGQEKRGRS